MFLLYKDKSHLHTDCKARFMWGFLVWREGFAICILNFFRSVREQAEKQNCSFWAQHLLLLARRMPSSHVPASPLPGRSPHHPPLNSKVRILPLHTGTRKLNFLCKALTYNSMSYESTMMTPIRNDHVNDN